METREVGQRTLLLEPIEVNQIYEWMSELLTLHGVAEAVADG